MTLEEVERLPGEVLTIEQIAPCLQSCPQTIRTQAHKRPELLGFPVIITGRRVKIPKRAFVKYMKGITDIPDKP